MGGCAGAGAGAGTVTACPADTACPASPFATRLPPSHHPSAFTLAHPPLLKPLRFITKAEFCAWAGAAVEGEHGLLRKLGLRVAFAPAEGGKQADAATANANAAPHTGAQRTDI